MNQRSIARWFAPPEFARLDLQRSARALWIVSWPLFVVVTVLLSLAVLVDPHTLARRATTVAALGVLVTVLHMTSRAGRPVLASWILVAGLNVIATQRAWITGGIQQPVAVFYVLFIIVAGALLGARGAIVTAAACMLGAIVLTAGSALGWLARIPGAGSPLGDFVFVALGICLALVLNSLVMLRPPREALNVDAVQLLVADLRSPMQVLVSHLDVLRAELRGDSLKDVEAALRGVGSLRRLTSSLLDVTRLQAGRMSIRRSVTDLSALAHSVVSAVRTVQPTCDIAVETRGTSLCNCDAELTRRIIDNLVSNALKVTPIGGHVSVVIAGSRRDASIAVVDEGAAMTPEERTRIFEPYRVTAEESAGLGLAFCKLAVDAQGGTIRIEEGIPRGNVFVVDLPRLIATSE